MTLVRGRMKTKITNRIGSNEDIKTKTMLIAAIIPI